MTHPPLAPCVHNPTTENESTRTTNEVSGTKLFDNVGIGVPAVRADEPDCEVGAIAGLLVSLHRRLRERKGLRVGHYRMSWFPACGLGTEIEMASKTFVLLWLLYATKRVEPENARTMQLHHFSPIHAARTDN